MSVKYNTDKCYIFFVCFLCFFGFFCFFICLFFALLFLTLVSPLLGQKRLKLLPPKRSQHFLEPRPWPEGSYELESVCPSVLSSRSFLGIGSLVFCETQHGVDGPCVVVHDRARFLKKIFLPKNGRNGAKKQGFLKFTGKFSH